MEKEIYEQILLKKIKNIEKAQYVIYGTKDVALVFYNEVVKKFGEDSISFFIDGKKESDYFKGKPVYKCDEITDKKVNDYKYIIGSVTKIPLFINNLKKAGVKEENIMDTINYFSADYIEANIKRIDNIYLYPQIESKENLEEIIKGLDNYIIVPRGSNQRVKIYTTINTEMPLPYGYELSNENVQLSKKEENDFVLVWDSKSLIDKDLENVTKFFCYDDKVVVHLNSKILSAVMTKFVQTNSEVYYKELSKQHFRDLLQYCKDFETAIVCGTGPSIQNMGEKYKNLVDKSSVVVCNGFYNMEKELKNVIPKAYIIQDNDLLTCELRFQMDQIADYVIRNNVYLCVDFRWVKLCCIRYPLLEEKIIGFERRDYNVFPSENELVYTNSDNVITSMGLPIASSLADRVFILGCDGGNWSHAYSDDSKESEEALINYKKSFLHPDYSSSISEYVDKLNSMYQNILEYGESRGKKYSLLAHSAIGELEKRFCNYEEIDNI